MGVPSTFTLGTRARSKRSTSSTFKSLPINPDKPTKQLYNATLPHELTLIHLQIFISLTSVLQFSSSLRPWPQSPLLSSSSAITYDSPLRLFDSTLDSTSTGCFAIGLVSRQRPPRDSFI